MSHDGGLEPREDIIRARALYYVGVVPLVTRRSVTIHTETLTWEDRDGLLEGLKAFFLSSIQRNDHLCCLGCLPESLAFLVVSVLFVVLNMT